MLLTWDARRGGAVLAVVELAGRHEVGYLQHCRRYAGRHAARAGGAGAGTALQTGGSHGQVVARYRKLVAANTQRLMGGA